MSSPPDTSTRASTHPARPDQATFRRRRILVVGAALLVLLGVVVAAVLLWPRPVSVAIDGVQDDALLGAADLEGFALTITPGPETDPSVVLAQLDGAPVPLESEGGSLVLRPDRLADGAHELRVEIPAEGPFGRGETVERSFTVDTTAPSVGLEDSVQATSLTDPLTVQGTVEGAEEVSVEGAEVTLADGSFEATFPSPPSEVVVLAADTAGNTTTAEMAVSVTHPGMRAVHMTGLAWASDELREPIIDLVEAGKIDTIELDIKDEAGIVGYESQVPLAREIGATQDYYDPRAAVEEIHALGARVVGRIVAFRDPVLGEYSWMNGAPERVVQTTSGEAYGGQNYGDYSFTNPANEEVQQYNIDLAKEAASLGFDDILWDYIRRPDGSLDKFVFPGIEGDPSAEIVEFLADSRAAVRPEGAYVGVSVYGIASTRGAQIAQDVPAMVEHADYIAPMVYPSHWGPGEYGVADPNAQPYDIVAASLADFTEIAEGTDVLIVPWLQDFSLGMTYGPAEVRAQIDAAAANGIDSFLLWNAASRYTGAAL